MGHSPFTPKTPPAGEGPRPLATPREVSVYLQKPVKTLAQWRYLGIGPAYTRQGRDVRYDWEDVFAWVRGTRIDTGDTDPAA